MHLRYTFYRLALLTILLFAALPGYAQVEISPGIDVSYPLMINKYNQRLNYGQVGFGLRFGVSYKPTGTQFFPTLNFMFGRTRLPLQQIDQNVAYENFNYKDLILNGNYVVTLNNNNSLYIIGGIGFTYLGGAGSKLSGKNGDASYVTIDSISNQVKFMPAIDLGVEYVYGDAVNQKIYMSLGLSLKYIIFLNGDNTYHLTIADYNKQATLHIDPSLTGHAIVPTFYITLHYLLGKEVIFWKKHDSRYE